MKWLTIALKHGKIKWLFLAVGLFLFSCAQENPDLVSPEPASKTVNFRLLNLCDANSSLNLGESVETESVGKYGISSVVSPPLGDSLTLKIKSNGIIAYSSPIKFRLIRDTKYTLISLPNPKGHSPEGAFNQYTIISTSLKIMLNEGKSYLTSVSCYPDSTAQFKITLGCPNGSPIASSLLYRLQEDSKEIDAGNMTLSLSMMKSGRDSLINLYDLNLSSKSEVALIIYENNAGQPDLWILDLNNPDKSALSPAVINQNRNTLIRTINFSESSVIIEKDGGIALDNVSAGMITPYKSISSCASATQDTIFAIAGNDRSQAVTTLEVSKKFSILVFDSAGKNAGLTVIANPARFPAQNSENKCILRVVNAAYYYPSVTVSLGARWSDAEIGYRSGEVLASNIIYGAISNPVYINAGRAPVTLFTSHQPPSLLLPALTKNNLEAGKSYLLIVTNDEKGIHKLNLIEDDVENTAIGSDFELTKGIFTQVLHANSQLGTMTIGLADIQAAKVYYKGFLSTVMPAGENSLIMNNNTNTYTVDDVNKRGLIIIGDNNKIFNKSELPKGTGRAAYRFKFINISDFQVKCILENYNYTEILNPGDASENYYENGLPGKLNISFVNPETSTSFYRLDGVEMSFGMNYSVIFTGKSALVKSEY